MSAAGGGHPLVDGAAAFRLDVYGVDARCDAGTLASGASAPIASQTYARGEAIRLDVPPGRHTVVLTSFADAAATMALGQACTDADLAPGSEICFDLTLAPAPDGGFVPPPGDCVTAADCDATHSAGARCVDGTCEYGGCSTGWANCSTAAPDRDGCETNTDTDVEHCGSCSRPCSSANVAARHCTAGLCDSTCSGSFSNCKQPPAGATPVAADDGCEAPPHLSGIGATAIGWGLGQTYASCNPLGTPGDPTTYTVDMVTAARAALTASGTDNTGSSCGAADCVHRVGTDFCVVWCFSNDTSA